jgi:hypothetical protein
MPITLRAAVYEPPQSDLPYVVVIFKPDNEVLSARAVMSLKEGENLIEQFFKNASLEHP